MSDPYNPNNLPIPRTSVTDMVAAYRQSEVEIRQAYGLLMTAQKRLHEAFRCEQHTWAFDLDQREMVDYDNPDKTMLRLKHAAWKRLVDMTGIKSAMSLKRAKELEEQLEGKSNCYGQKVEPLPEITESNILAMMEQTANQLPAMIEEAVKEVYEWLRPYQSTWRPDYKTNLKNEWELGKKVIKGYCIENSYSHEKPFRVAYQRQQNITALDNVFQMLDGKGIVKTHYGPLTDAIAASTDGTGETEYFKFKCFGNRNLHIEFKRMDLVARLNAVAGGMRLKNEQKAA